MARAIAADTAAKTDEMGIKTEIETLDDSSKKIPAKKSSEKKTTAKKDAEKEPEVIMDTVAKTQPVTVQHVDNQMATKTSFFIQFNGLEIEQNDIVSKVKNVWITELDKKMTDMKTLNIYVKPEEQAAYYVINETETGCITL